MLATRIGEYDYDPDPYFAERDTYVVNVNADGLMTVAFIGIKRGGKFLPRATCFFVNYTEDGHRFTHLVTAEHVISGLLSKGHDIWVRVNVVGPKGAIEIPISEADKAFHFHPDSGRESTDVAVCPFRRQVTEEETGETFEFAIRTMSLNKDDKDGFWPTEELRSVIGLGSEIAIIGLFRSHYGTNRNIPVVRVGNIAAMPGEPVFTKYGGHMKAYLVESRSIAGLSGSPVLAFPDSSVLLAHRLANRSAPNWQGCALLGLMHGHFDVRNLNEDVVADEDAPERSVHTGMGVVIPVEKILETIEQPDLTAMRKEVVAKLREEKGATADVIDDDPSDPNSEANPRGREDFKRLVDVAARKRPQGDQT